MLLKCEIGHKQTLKPIICDMMHRSVIKIANDRIPNNNLKWQVAFWKVMVRPSRYKIMKINRWWLDRWWIYSEVTRIRKVADLCEGANIDFDTCLLSGRCSIPPIKEQCHNFESIKVHIKYGKLTSLLRLTILTSEHLSGCRLNGFESTRIHQSRYWTNSTSGQLVIKPNCIQVTTSKEEIKNPNL